MQKHQVKQRHTKSSLGKSCKEENYFYASRLVFLLELKEFQYGEFLGSVSLLKLMTVIQHVG